MYAQLSQSYQWTQLNKNGVMMNKLNDAFQNGRTIYPDDIPQAILKLKNRNKSPITASMMQAIADGEMVLIYAPEVKIPTYLPFIVSQPAQNSYVVYVFLNNLVTNRPKDKNDELELNDRPFKVALEAAFLSLQIRKLGESPKLYSSAIMKSGSKIYSGIVTECINRKHSIKLDLNVYNSVLYLTTKYYITTMLGRKNLADETMQNYCLYNCKEFDVLEINRIVEQFEEPDFENIATLISKMSSIPEMNKRLGTMTVTNFLESYINMYDTSMFLSLEMFPYFLYNIIAVNESTYINNYQSLKNIVGDDGRKIYADLIVTLGGN